MTIRHSIIAAIAVLAVAAAGWFLYPHLTQRAAPKPFFADWGAVVVAGDWRAASGEPSDVFDNGRRAIAKKLVAAGFPADHVLQYSVQPQRHTQDLAMPATAEEITEGLNALGRNAPGGCLAYFTSHGEEGEGIIIGDRLVDPAPIAERITAACGDRPTVVVISACFAGQFIPALRGPRRIVLAAARADRSSFGCGEDDEYTFYDACMLQQFDRAAGFRELASFVEDCVRKREAEMDMDPPSEPQFFMGADVAHANWK